MNSPSGLQRSAKGTDTPPEFTTSGRVPDMPLAVHSNAQERKREIISSKGVVSKPAPRSASSERN